MMQKKVYLDYAATTPVDPRVQKTMLPYLSENFGNTMSMHSFGAVANEAAEKSRAVLAKGINAKPKEIVFTSSATESNNLALKGVAFANRDKGNHIIVSSIEHDCVLNSAKWLKKQGFEIEYLVVDKYGLVSIENLKKIIRKETILVSVMHANNEIGTIEPIEEIGRACKERGVYFHTDAAQTFGKVPIDVGKMNIDLLTASSHKLYGPKGAAFLYIKQGVHIQPLLHGGGHEFGLRSSTVNVPAIIGFSKAFQICEKEMAKEGRRLKTLRDMVIKEVLKKIPDTRLNGHPEKRLANNINFSFMFVDGEAIVAKLDEKGIAVSTGSACSSPRLEPNHVLLAIGLSPEQAHGSLRVTLGRWTKKEEITYFLKVLPQTISDLRQISPFKVK